MALTDEQLVLTAEIVREPYSDVAAAASLLIVAQESFLSDDIDTWEANRNDVELIMSGGSDGVNLDTRRLLAEIFYRTRNMLGFDDVPFDRDVSGESLELFELEVGQAFG